jgi:hypothetical protein
MPATVLLCSKRAPGNMDSSYVLDCHFRGNDKKGPLTRLRHRFRRPLDARGEASCFLRLKCSLFSIFRGQSNGFPSLGQEHPRELAEAYVFGLVGGQGRVGVC